MRAITALLFTLLTGCSALSEQQCRVGDWYTLGYQDGVNGKGKERLASYREACSEYGVVPDHYEYIGNDVYQVYVKIDDKIVPYVAVNWKTGDFHG